MSDKLQALRDARSHAREAWINMDILERRFFEKTDRKAVKRGGYRIPGKLVEARRAYDVAQRALRDAQDAYDFAVWLLRSRVEREVSALPEIAALADAARIVQEKYSEERCKRVEAELARLVEEAGLVDE